MIINSQSKLDYKMGQMVVRGETTKRVIIDEIAILVIENPAVSFTGCLMEALIEKKVRVVFCDSKRNPVAELSPHHGSHDSTLKIRTQAKWSQEIKAVIWQEIISEKIRKQRDFLLEIDKKAESELLSSYIGQVKLLDASNREGHAAKVYFNALFGMDFTRGADNPINAALNYGYSLILSAFNREVVINGYLTQLGIFHDNMFNHFNLSCDLMEPFRVLIDRWVRSDCPLEFGKEEKHKLWNVLSQTVMIDGAKQSLDRAIKIYTKSVFDAINSEDTGELRFFTILQEAR